MGDLYCDGGMYSVGASKQCPARTFANVMPRTILFIYIHDTGFAIFSNYPPRTRIQEMSLGMACPEACFQAQTATECLSAIRTWTAHPLWGCRRTLRDIVKVMFCKDINLDVRAYISHLGILNLWIVCSGKNSTLACG